MKARLISRTGQEQKFIILTTNASSTHPFAIRRRLAMRKFLKTPALREFIAEFLATMVLIAFGDGVVAQVRGPIPKKIFVTEIVRRILTKVNLEKETCINFSLMPSSKYLKFQYNFQ